MKESPWGKFKREIEQEIDVIQAIDLELTELTDLETINYQTLSSTLEGELNND
jgi:hypothetical protein